MELIKLVKWVRSFLVDGFLFLAFAPNQTIYLQKPAAPLKFYMEKSHRFIHIIVLQELREDSSITLCLKVIKKNKRRIIPRAFVSFYRLLWSLGSGSGSCFFPL